MGITITLPEELALELRHEAGRLGVDPQTYATQLIRAHLPAARAEAARSLFSDWAAEDRTDSVAELADRESDWEHLKSALNANRGTGRKLF